MCWLGSNTSNAQKQRKRIHIPVVELVMVHAVDMFDERLIAIGGANRNQQSNANLEQRHGGNS